VTISIAPESYAFLQGWIVRATGIVIEENKAYLLESRLAAILETERFPDFETLCMRLRLGIDRALERKVIDAMTTNETTFFRDILPFEAMQQHIFPNLIRNRPPNRKLTIWSAAASSGQEAYSLAMMLREMGMSHHEVEILGTDLSHEILQKAEAACYGPFEMNRGVPPLFLERYFTQSKQEWRVNDDVRRMVRFEQFDLRQGGQAFGPYDVVLCRNVCIYFDAATKSQILSSIRQRMTTGGYLLLGGAESVSGGANFTRTMVGQAAFYLAC
jgi:chemotaxis protein methyltransferase CheR